MGVWAIHLRVSGPQAYEAYKAFLRKAAVLKESKEAVKFVNDLITKEGK